MDRNIDTDVTMVTNKAFNKVLSCVQDSGLNFQIQMSPFSASISLKKSLVRNLVGSPVLPTISIMEDNIDKHERELQELRKSCEDIVQKLRIAYQTIEVLQIDVNNKNEINNNVFCSNVTSHNSTSLSRKNILDDDLKKEKCDVEVEFA